MHDAILVLGGGVRDGGELPPWVVARFDRALEVEQGEPIVCLSAGTTHRPPPLEDGFPIAESVAGARYLIAQGVPPGRIRIENTSYDTIGNAYFAKLIHVDPPAWRRLLVITSEFHMPRSQAVFEWVFGFERDRYELAFEASPDAGIERNQLAFRRNKEAAGMEGFQSLRSRIGSLRDLHTWLFTEHRAYTADGQWRQDRARDPRLIESY